MGLEKTHLLCYVNLIIIFTSKAEELLLVGANIYTVICTETAQHLHIIM